MKRIFSYIESNGITFKPPTMLGPDARAPEYLMQHEGRHYVAVEGDLPAQHPALDVRGPYDLSKEPALRNLLARRAEPLRMTRTRRAEAYPDIGDQLDALMAEFAWRREHGEELSSALNDVLDQCLAVKARHPKPDIGLDEHPGPKGG